MARVNLEERFFGSRRLERFKELMGWSKPMAVGTLALLWHESQIEQRAEATFDEIVDWCWGSREGADRLVAALVESRFLRETADRYLIAGNEDQLEWLSKQRAASAKGGEANKNRILRELSASHMDSQSDSRIEPVEPQCKAMQGNAKQREKSKPLGSASGPPPSDSDFALADTWLEHAKTVSPNLKASRESFAKALRLLRTSDGFTDEALRSILAFVKTDEFWSKAAISPAGLRGQSRNGLRKIDNVVAAMKARGDPEGKSYVDDEEYWADFRKRVAAEEEAERAAGRI